MNIKPIKTKKDHRQALKRIEEIWDAKLNTPEGDELDILSTLVESYEKEKYSIAPPDAIEAIKFRIEQMGLTKKDLAEFLGGTNRVSEIFHGKRKLTIKMIRALYENLQVPIESMLC